MAPGPKKKSFNKHTGDSRQDNKKKTEVESQPRNKNVSSCSDPIDKDAGVTEDKYSKRSLQSNWSKYDEQIVDPHADTMRGKDFEVLLSYSGGGHSQLLLQNEKEWDDTCIGDKSIAFDLLELENAVKCVPFHKRIQLPEDIFNAQQLKVFHSVAENQKKVFTKKLGVPNSIVQESFFKEPEIIQKDSDIIESYELEKECKVPEKCFVLEEKTEKLIDSLASSLAMKSLHSPFGEQCEKTSNEPDLDNLDFLLSLGTTSKNARKEDQPKEKTQTNVDDWLNNLLDD